MDRESKANELMDELFMYFHKWQEKVSELDMYTVGQLNIAINNNEDDECYDARYTHNLYNLDIYNIMNESVLRDVLKKEEKE